MQLIDVAIGKKVRVIAFQDGLGLARKLRQIGIMPGDCAKVLRYAPFNGPVLIEVGGRSIALGWGIASKIEVEDSECDSH